VLRSGFSAERRYASIGDVFEDVSVNLITIPRSRAFSSSSEDDVVRMFVVGKSLIMKQ